MPPRKKLDACMFCAPNPCACSGKKASKSPRKKTDDPPDDAANVRLVENVASQPKVDFKAAMREQAEEDAKPKPQQQMHARLKERPVVQDDPEFVACLMALEPLLHSDERERYADKLNKVGTPGQRWRLRNVNKG